MSRVVCVHLAPLKLQALRILQHCPKSVVQSGHFILFLCRQKSISKQWEDLLDQLQRREQSLGTMQEILGLLRDIDAITEELKELQVLSPLHQHTTFSAANVCPHVPGTGWCQQDVCLSAIEKNHNFYLDA